MPYGFFQIVRFTALSGFSILAYYSYKENKIAAITIVYIALAVLFQPFFKIALGRTIWNIVDVTVGISLLVSLFFKNKLHNEK